MSMLLAGPVPSAELGLAPSAEIATLRGLLWLAAVLVTGAVSLSVSADADAAPSFLSGGPRFIGRTPELNAQTGLPQPEQQFLTYRPAGPLGRLSYCGGYRVVRSNQHLVFLFWHIFPLSLMEPPPDAMT
jgi:hypothetical protein